MVVLRVVHHIRHAHVDLIAHPHVKMHVLDAPDVQIHAHHLVLMHVEQTVFRHVREHALHRVHLAV